MLNSVRSCIAFGGLPLEVVGHHRGIFDEVALRLIRGIVLRSGTSIVLSSSWRILHPYREIAEELDLPIIDATPRRWEAGQVRGHEIQAWLSGHPEVEAYAIIDDDSDMLDEQKPFFVHTSNYNGLMWQDAVRLADLLGIDIYDVNHPGRAHEPHA